MKTEYLSRAAFGKRVGISGQMVGRHVREKGLPTQPDGKIELTEGLAWWKKFIAPTKSGNYRFRQERKAKQSAEIETETETSVAEIETETRIETASDLFARLHGHGMVRLAGLMKALGLDAATQTAGLSVVSLWLWDVAGDRVAFGCGASGPPMDYSGLGGVELTADEETEASRTVQAAEEFLGFSE